MREWLLGIGGVIASLLPWVFPEMPFEGKVVILVAAVACLVFVGVHIARGSWESWRRPVSRQPDTWLHDAISRAYYGYRDRIPFIEGRYPQADIPRLADIVMQEVRQKALDGALPVWGKVGASDPFKPIPKDYWATHKLDWFSFLENDPLALVTEPDPDKSRPTERWKELRVRYDDVDRLWPRMPRPDRASLRLYCGEGHEFYRVPRHTLDGMTREVGIVVENAHPSRTLTNCQLSITAIEPDTGHRFPRPFGDPFSLDPGARRFVAVARYNEIIGSISRDTVVLIMTTRTAATGDAAMAVDLDHVIRLRATARNTPAAERSYRLRVTTNGVLRLEEVDPNDPPTIAPSQPSEPLTNNGGD
jgi:hypothetical protein